MNVYTTFLNDISVFYKYAARKPNFHFHKVILLQNHETPHIVIFSQLRGKHLLTSTEISNKCNTNAIWRPDFQSNQKNAHLRCDGTCHHSYI